MLIQAKSISFPSGEKKYLDYLSFHVNIYKFLQNYSNRLAAKTLKHCLRFSNRDSVD